MLTIPFETPGWCSLRLISVTAYTCFASWQDNNTRYVIASPIARTSTDPRLYCLVYTLSGNSVQQSLLDGTLGGRNAGPPMLRLSAVTESCHRHVVPGASGLWFFNFTNNGWSFLFVCCCCCVNELVVFVGTCAESGNTNVGSVTVPPTVVIGFWSLLAAVLLR